ncbi:hypothetical protein BH11ACT4_BH11ACT4_09860 [soil metagenome]
MVDDTTPWFVPIARAVPAVALAAVITFSADHSATLGLVTFGVYALASGAVVLVAALRAAPAGVQRGLLVGQGGLGIVAGGASLAVPGAGLPFLVFLITAWAILTGFLELYAGLRGRRAAARVPIPAAPAPAGRAPSFDRDRVFLGAFTVLLAIAVLLVPPGFVQSFTGPDGVVRALTASIVVVGLLGAYWAIAGIYLVIAGLSLKWGTETRPLSTAKGQA